MIEKGRDPLRRVFFFFRRAKKRMLFPSKMVLQTAGFSDKIEKSPPQSDLFTLDNYRIILNKVVR
ncbi:MAG: hypothetical protein II771_00730 [Clostridia bacterium]|nr:hypothetical protein [Clostridia bacterium]